MSLVGLLTRPRMLFALAGALLVAALAFVFAPLLGDAFDGIALRVLLALLPVVAWAGVGAVLWKRGASRDAALSAAAVAPDPSATALREEEEELRERLAAALGRLREALGARGALYDIPWYVIIGPPGAGKTTAIQQSGLSFPLAEGARIGGAGGTRSCDWWLSEQAVLIDTAGRYTTQDSDAQVDRGAWTRFLDLLLRHRPRLPLNGVLVAFGVDQVARLTPAERDRHAQAVRSRIRELETVLKQRLPVYMLVTKADLLPGFVEFFADLDGHARAQVWGTTFPAETGPEGPAAAFGAEFQALVGRLTERVVDRLQAERGAPQRAAIAGFPGQVASLAEPLEAFLRAAFGGSRLDPAPFLRGVYLASGTQEGTPIDRLAGALARDFGVQPEPLVAIARSQARSYFLGRLLTGVVFNEAELAGPGGEGRKRMVIAVAAWGLAAIAVLGGAAWGWSAMNAEASRSTRLAAAVEAAEGTGAARPLDRVAPAAPDIAAVVSYLDAARALLPSAAGQGASLGLGQDAKLVAVADLAYRRALDRVLVPRLLARVEAQIRGGMGQPEFLYEATRIYLMLGRQGPLDAATIRAWAAADWAQALPGATAQPIRESLGAHTAALLDGEFHAYPLDGVLVDQARRVFSRLPPAERVYAQLRRIGAVAPPWRPAEFFGPAGERLFARPSGRPLTDSVPGLYTVEGLHRFVLPALPAAVREAAADSWVFGPETQIRLGPGSTEAVQLEQAVMVLYAEDYVRSWQALLADLQVRRFANLRDTAEGLNLLGAPGSPMREFLREAARQLSPGTAPTAAGGTAAGAIGTPAAAVQRVTAAVGAATSPSSAEPVARIVEARFQDLRQAATGAPMEEALRLVSEVFEQTARLAAAPPGTALPPMPGLSPSQRLIAFAARQPEPMAGWLRSLAQTAGGLQTGSARATINAAGGEALRPFCGPGFETRFPFRTSATAEMPVNDFGRLFGPGGTLDGLFSQHVRPYVDTTTRPWRPVAAEGGAPPVSPADLAQFQRAAAIRDAFFPGVGGLRFELVPMGLDAGATGATLEAEGLTAQLPARGTGRAITLTWPARGPVTLGFEPAASAGTLNFDGAWATLRLVAAGRLISVPNAPDRFRLEIRHGDRAANFELRAGSSVHPFGLRDLAEFRCPTLPQ